MMTGYNSLQLTLLKIFLLKWLISAADGHRNIHQYVNRFKRHSKCGSDYVPDVTVAITDHQDMSVFKCARSCSRSTACTGFGYKTDESKCVLGNKHPDSQNCTGLKPSIGFVYFEETMPGFCLNDGTYSAAYRLCRNCAPAWTGQRCGILAIGCEDYCNAHVRQDGSYWRYIRPGGLSAEPIYVRCSCYVHNMGCTTLSLRGYNVTDNFNRTWSEYRDGFNNSRWSYWMGLENLYRILQNDRRYALVVELRARTNNSIVRRVVYEDLTIDTESNDYRIGLNETDEAMDSKFRVWGDAFFQDGDTTINNMAFSTYDRDNDESELNCAEQYGGGWWFNNCTGANLNGFWQPTANQPITALKTWTTVAKKYGGPAIGATKLFVCAIK